MFAGGVGAKIEGLLNSILGYLSPLAHVVRLLTRQH